MPDLVLTSDIIIGFPGETEAEAMDTVSLINEVHFDALFTFIFSPRPGTPAAKLDDPTPREEKQKWFDALCNAQTKTRPSRIPDRSKSVFTRTEIRPEKPIFAASNFRRNAMNYRSAR